MQYTIMSENKLKYNNFMGELKAASYIFMSDLYGTGRGRFYAPSSPMQTMRNVRNPTHAYP